MSWLSWHIWKKMSFFQLQINQRKKTELQQHYSSFDWIQKRFFLDFHFLYPLDFAKSHLSFFFSNLQTNRRLRFFSNLHRWQIWNVNMTWFFCKEWSLVISTLVSVMKLRSFFVDFFVKEKIWGHLLKSSPVMIRMSGICLQATRIRFSCDFARFSKNNKTGIETDDFECQEKCQTLQQAIHTIRLQSRPICHGRPKTRVADQILDQTLSFFIRRIFSPS